LTFSEKSLAFFLTYVRLENVSPGNLHSCYLYKDQ